MWAYKKASKKSCKTSKSKQQDRETPTDVGVGDVLTFLKEFEAKQEEKLESMSDKVDELYYYDYDEAEEGLLLRENSDNEPENINLDEPPTKRAKAADHNDQITIVDTESMFSLYAKKYKNSETTDAEVDCGLADMVNLVFREGLTDEKLADLTKSINRPANCTALQKTRVNQLVWNLLSNETKTDDSKFQFIQNCIIKASSNITKVACEVNKLNQTGSMQTCLQMISDSLALLGHTNKLINLKRKELHKPDLGRDYFHLSSQSVPYTDLLYGDDVTKNVKEIQDINRIGKKLTSHNTRGGYDRFF
ncbi:hypothetical protein SNE40_017539 [Patella caerulea]|uniref:Uncharacterized protein n=1 Tax=Patella caerulea TaxID=87958 RepID=A0AAN8JCE6_PATCE